MCVNAIASALACSATEEKTDRGKIRGQTLRAIHSVSIVQLSDERVRMSLTKAKTLCE